MLGAVRTVLVIAAGLAVVTVAIAALGGSSAAQGGGVPVVATTTQAADLTRAVAGPRASVHGVLAPNTDPHDYEVRARDVKALVDARLVIRSGGDVDAWLGDALDSAGAGAPVVDLIAAAGPEGEDPTGGRTRGARSGPWRRSGGR